jgi:transporter family-2 protein
VRSAEQPAPSRQTFAVAAAALVGVGLAFQARVNGELGTRLDDPIAASLISSGVGLVILLAVVPTTRTGRRALARIRQALLEDRLRWWQCLGGLSGALFVASQGASVGPLGVGVFTVAVVGGTSAGSLAVDRAGLGPGGQRPITVARVVGAVACVAAVGLAGQDRLSHPATLTLLGLPVVAGIAVAVQAALNGRVGVAAGSPWAAALVNSVVAMCALCLALVVDVALRGWPTGPFQQELWLYSGGLVGVGVITIATSVVRRIGVLVFGLASVSGQLVGAVILDALGAHRPSTSTLIAVVITLAAVVLAVRPSR